MTTELYARSRTLAERLVNGPAGFRRLLERLGPTFVKIGQFLALRPDLVPQEYCDELLKLLDEVRPFPWAEAQAILQEDLGAHPLTVFAEIDPAPIAAGSLAQMHLARAHDGRELAVKILRPGIAERVKADLSRVRVLARILEISGASFIASPREVTEEITKWMAQELDFSHELSNIMRLHDLARGQKSEKIPRPYPRLSSARVITMEYLHGIPFSALISRQPSAEQMERIKACAIDYDQLSANLLECVLGQIFRYKFFHADLHPGNLLALPGNAIGFVDFGLCDALDETVRERQLSYLRAVYDRDVNGMFQALSEVLVPGENTDMDRFRTDFFAETHVYLSQIEHPRRAIGQASEQRSPISQWMVRIMHAARRNDLRLPPSILTMYRALLTAEIVAAKLGGNANLRIVGREFFRRLQMEDLIGSFTLARMESQVLTLTALCQDLPRQVQQILSDAAAGQLEMNVNVAESSRVRRLRNRRAQLISTAILTVGIAFLLGGPRVPTLFNLPLTWPLGVLLVLLFGAVLWQWRHLK